MTSIMHKLSIFTAILLLIAGCGSNPKNGNVKSVSATSLHQGDALPSATTSEKEMIAQSEVPDIPPRRTSDERDEAKNDAADGLGEKYMREDYPLELDILQHVRDIYDENAMEGWNQQKFMEAADDYISKALDISLGCDQKSVMRRLERIDSLCEKYGWIDGDGSKNPNYDMQLIWKAYLSWRYLTAVKNQCPQVDWENEEHLLCTLSDRLKSCVYNGGNGHYSYYSVARMGVDIERQDCLVNMMRSCLYGIEDTCKTIIPDAAFKKLFTEVEHMVFEFDYNERQQDGSYAIVLREEERPDLIHSLSAAFWQWRRHRYKTFWELNSSSPDLASAYLGASRRYEKVFFIHVKNHFEDLGVVPASFFEILLQLDCTDEEMYAYSYDEAYEAYIK